MSTTVAVPAVRQFTLAPESIDEAIRVCDLLAKSSIVPKEYQGNPGNILVAIQWGMELGLQPLQAMQSIAVINGRPCIWGDTVLALIRQSGRLEFIHEEVIDGVARCTVKRRSEDPVTREFSLEDAKRAGLANKQGPWQQYPTRMLQLRARAFALRDVFPDVLRGMHVREEVEDSVAPLSSPAADAITAPTRTEALRQRLALQCQPTPTITLDTVLALIASGDLDEAAVQAKKLQNADDKKAARVAYVAAKHAALQQLSNAALSAPPASAPLITAEQLAQLRELIDNMGITLDSFSRRHGDTDITELTAQQAQQAIDELLQIHTQETQ